MAKKKIEPKGGNTEALFSMSPLKALTLHLICGLGLLSAFWYVKAVGRGLLALPAGAVVNALGATILGAPVGFEYFPKTLHWSLLMSLLTFVPAACVFGSSWSDWHRIFARTKANESTDYMISLPAHGAVIGAWFGAWPMPLDWESPWQVCYLIVKDSSGGKRSRKLGFREYPVKTYDEESPIKQVRLTVSNEDDPSLPVWTFRMWFLGILSCAVLSFLYTFFSYRAEPLVITMITVQVATLPIGRLMARVLPTRMFKIMSWEFTLNPGPFNMKEHVLISIFANAGSAFFNGPAYAVGIVDIIKGLYFRNISFLAGWILVVATQVLGYGWAGIMRKLVVDPAEMWWPSSLVQVSLFRALHEKEGEGKTSRGKFFLIVLDCSFIWYMVPGYLFPTLSNLSLICLVYRKSVFAQQLGSGMKGL
ncbi:Oligopeptide transporter 4 [Capsicum annuum]|uniref:Oligopeptide transporter 4 n=1 Tax=Capsicum annuum TaxID=4072 RepID=A0A2G3A2P9_CAPAN|nr:Oligopeptide transporter 4 [Capsicum annuum]PHT88507.1 Oligopeptide transporter 4 [Capsicum annuum]